MMALARSADEPYLVSAANLALGTALSYMGEFSASLDHIRQAIAFYERHQPPQTVGADPRTAAEVVLGGSLCYLGYPDQGLATCRQAVARARALPNPYNLAYALCFDSGVHLISRESRQAAQSIDAASRICGEHGFQILNLLCRIVQGYLRFKLNRSAEALADLSGTLALGKTRGLNVGRPLFLGWLGDAYAMAGRIEEGLSSLAEGLALAEHTGEARHTAILYRLQGELLLMGEAPDQAGAQRSFRKAIELACRQGTRLFELGATAGLARLLAAHQRTGEARAMLAEICEWFPEGLEIAELKEAQGLLEALR